MDYQPMIDGAEGILRQTFGVSISLEMAAVVYDYDDAPSTILRCKTSKAVDGIPKTVIVKQSNGEDDSLLYEAAALEFLDEVLSGLAPHPYGTNSEKRLMVIEDLGHSDDDLLGNILFKRDADSAEASLTEFQRVLARMHLGTMGREDRLVEIRARYKPTKPSRHRIHHIPAALRELPALWESMGVSMSSEAREEIDEAIQIIESPGVFKALVHGDATPANAFYADGNIRLFDLETAAFRHCLLDGTYGRIRYIHSVWARYIPPGVQRRITGVYRETFLAGCAIDSTTFDQHFVACSAGWLAGLCKLLPDVTASDRKWGRSSNRQRIVAGLGHFAILSDEVRQFESLGKFCHTAEERLRGMWPEADCTMRVYPSFDMDI